MFKPGDRIRYTLSQPYTATVLRVVGDVNPLVAALAKTVDIQRVMKRGDLIVKVDGHDQELPLPVGVIPIELILISFSRS